MVMSLVVNIDQVRDDCRNLLLDSSYRPGLPCHEVDDFGDFQYDPTYAAPCKLRGWPKVWAVALIEGDNDFTLSFHFHALHESRNNALLEARRLSLSLLRNQETRRQCLRRSVGPTLLDTDARDAEVDPYVAFEDRVRRERVFFGPLSEAGLAPFIRADRSGDVFDDLLDFQQSLATKLLCLVTRALRILPSGIRRSVCSFAFTPRACPLPRHVPELLRVSIRIRTGVGYAPFIYRWVASLPCDATLNDVCRLVQIKLCELCERQPIGERWYEIEHVLGAIVLLMPIPFRHPYSRPGPLPPYFYQAHHVQQFTKWLPRKNGLIHIDAVAVDRDIVISST